MQKRTIKALLEKIQDKDPIIPTIIKEIDEDMKESEKVGWAMLILAAGIVVGTIFGILWLKGF